MWLVREKERQEELVRQGIVVEEEEEERPEEEYKPSIWIRIYYNGVFRGLLLILPIAILIPIFIVLFLDMTNPEFDGTHSCSVEIGYQIPCGIQNTTFAQCSSLKCCFNETDCSCFHKVRSYYQYTQEEDSHSDLFQPKEEMTPFGKVNDEVYLYIKKENSYKLEISLSTKQDDNKNDNVIENEEYKIQVFKTLMAVEVNRSKSNERLLTTTRGPTIISDKYWEWTVDLFADHLFGMDHLHFPFNESTTKVIYKNAMEHSSIARFMSYSSEKYHGLEIEHSGPLEVTITQAKLIVLKSFSGTRLTLRLTTGPTPVDVLRQLRNNEAWAPVPYWMLGVHICRDGNATDIDKILEEFNSFESTMPYDSDCIHENLFSLSRNKGNTEIDAAVVKLKTKKKFLMSLSPQVLFDETAGSNYKKAEEQNILYTKDTKVFIGEYLNETVAYPDYSSTKTQQWFKDMYDTELAHLNPDGFVLRNNWPVNDNYKMDYTKKLFQYMPKTVEEALSNTLPWNSVNSASIDHIDVHNTYGLDYTTVVSSQTKSNIILSSSYTQGSPYPAHTQNIDATWVNFKEMLRKSLSHSLFGGQLFSVPVCGDTTNFDKEINQGVCVRWYLTAATMPLFRLSSDEPRRDPSAYNHMKYVKNIMLEAIKIRYTLLPYFYTVMSENLPMVRAMFFNFPDNTETFDLDEQYMIGDGILVAQPSLFPVPSMRVYLPEINGGWYEFWEGMKFPQVGWVTIPIVESDLVAFIPAGKIVPVQDGIANSAEASQKKPLKLIIALLCTANDGQKTCNAKGTLFSTNSITVEFQNDNTDLNILNAEQCQLGKEADFTVSKVQVYKEEERFIKTLNDLLLFCVKKNASVSLPNVIQKT